MINLLNHLRVTSFVPREICGWETGVILSNSLVFKESSVNINLFRKVFEDLIPINK